MDIQPSEEQALLRDMVQRFLNDRAPAADAGRAPMQRTDWEEMAALGILGVALPEEAGGMGGRPQDAMIVAEELGRAFAITPFSESILAAADLVARRGSADQIDRWIGPVIEGRALIALTMGEVRLQDGKLYGRCDFVRWGADADAFVVVLDDDAYIVPGEAAGCERGPARLADGSVAATIEFQGCAAESLPRPVARVDISIAMAQLGYVAEMTGAMDTLCAQTIDYARQRQQFGAPIANFQAVQHKLARMFVRLEQSRSMLLKAGLTEREAPDFVRNVTAAKVVVAEAAKSVAEDAVQLHGGMGITDELPVGRALRRIIVLARLFGGADAALRRLAA